MAAVHLEPSLWALITNNNICVVVELKLALSFTKAPYKFNLA
jgi:hypothetical protein